MKYDAKILQGYAGRLYALANGVLLFYSVVGAVAGWCLGYAVIPSYFRNSNRPDPQGINLMSLLLGLLFGAAYGRIKGLDLKIRAQLVLCQVQIEENTKADSTIGG